MYPLGTVGRDMMYVLFNNFILLYVMYTRNLTNAQLGAITAIMFGARIFDALNDPIMGNIIERTRTKWGKFKPWFLIGMLLSTVVVYLAYNTDLQGWNFIIFFGIIYFSYSITFTMNDIAFWGMVPALSSDGDTRNMFTSRATLFAGIGNTFANVMIPLLTTGALAIGGNAKTAYGRIALIVGIIAPLFACFTLFGVKENRQDMETAAPPVSFKKIIGTIGHNDQLLLVAGVFLLQQVGQGLVTGGIGSNYIYFEFGYEGGLYSTFTTIGMLATAFLMVFYPTISRRIHRKQLATYLMGLAIVGYIVELAAGLAMPATTIKFWILTIGFMVSNFGQYGMYLILMISIINTVEYNEYKMGTRDEAIITSMRPFLTKFSSALIVVFTSLTYMIFGVTNYTNKISDLETAAEQGTVTAAEKSSQIADVIASVTSGQTTGLLIMMTVVPCILFILACTFYKKNYLLDEERYDEICKELESRRG